MALWAVGKLSAIRALAAYHLGAGRVTILHERDERLDSRCNRFGSGNTSRTCECSSSELSKSHWMALGSDIAAAASRARRTSHINHREAHRVSMCTALRASVGLKTMNFT